MKECKIISAHPQSKSVFIEPGSLSGAQKNRRKNDQAAEFRPAHQPAENHFLSPLLWTIVRLDFDNVDLESRCLFSLTTARLPSSSADRKRTFPF